MNFVKNVVAFAFLAFTQAINAQSPNAALPTVEELMRSPQLDQVRLSASGRYMAAVAPLNGRMNLVVIDLQSRSSAQVSSFEDFDVLETHWIGDARLVFSLGQYDAPTGPYAVEGGGLFVVDRDGLNGRRLAATVRESRGRNQLHRYLNFTAVIPGNDDEIIASGNLDVADSTDLYRVNLVTGKSVAISSGRPVSKPGNWLLDDKLVPRVVSGFDEEKNERVTYFRKSSGAPWVEIARTPTNRRQIFVPRYIDPETNTLIIASNQGRDTVGLFRFDPETKTITETIAGHPRFDMGADSAGAGASGLMLGPDRKLEALRVNADKPQVLWLSAAGAKAQASIDVALPESVNEIAPNADRSKWLVSSYSEQSPAHWYVYDTQTGKLEEVGRGRPWLEGKLKAKQLPIRFKARDGLDLTGYIFVPEQFKKGAPLPTVVHIHGGPHVRADYFARGFGVREATLLASRGYVVVLPNFRVTPGIGVKAYQAGFGTVGRAMSDDHEDALKWAVEQGYSDPARACISGASYGGYAALQAVARPSNPFKCAISGLAVTDLEFQNTSPLTDYTSSIAGVNFWKRLLGVKSFDEPIVRTISPLFNAEKIKSAVFMYGGREDRRVPVGQMERMAEALTKAGNRPKEFIVKNNEGHGFGLLANRVELYTKMLSFLETQIGR